MIEDGDVVSLVSQLLNINAYEAAKKINEVFSLGVNFNYKTSNNEIEKYKCKSKLIKQFREWENETIQLLCDYFHLLEQWKKINNLENDLFIESLQNKDYIDYLIDEFFIFGTDEDKIWFWKNNKNLISNIKMNIAKRKEMENE